MSIYSKLMKYVSFIENIADETTNDVESPRKTVVKAYSHDEESSQDQVKGKSFQFYQRSCE